MSEALQGKVKLLSEAIRSLLEYKNSKEREISYQSVCKACKKLSGCIGAFEGSLYAQKHAYYFRGLREWHDYNEV